MKTLKFKSHLAEQIIAGEKTSTWRLFDDKDLTVGDEVTFFDKETGAQFGIAHLTQVYTKTLGSLTDADWVGHERFVSEEEMYATYRQYYGDRVNKDTEVKIIHFTFVRKLFKKCVVVDENDQELGAEYIPIAIEKGLIRRVVRVFVFNQSGQVLVHRRSQSVSKPLLLEVSATGHVDEGESYELAAKRELAEELGLTTADLQKICEPVLFAEFYVGFYSVVVPDNEAINFSPEEVAEVLWYDKNELTEAIAKRPEEFTLALRESWLHLQTNGQLD